MKTIKIALTIAINILISIPIFAGEKARVAIMPFEAGQGVSKPETKYLTEKIRTGLIKTGKFDVISNDQLEQMLKVKQSKQEMGAGSCSSEKCIIDLGNALECEKMIVGTVGGAFKEYSINVKMLDVVKQKYEFAEEITIKSKDDFPDAAKIIVQKLSGVTDSDKNFLTSSSPGSMNFSGMIWRSLAAPGWGHVYANQNRGYLYGGLWLATGGAFLWSHLNYTAKLDTYNSADSDYRAKDDASTSAFKMRGYLSYAFIGVYLVTLSDMVFTGNGYAPPRESTSTNQMQMNVLYGSSDQRLHYSYRDDQRLELIIKWGF